MGFFCNFFDFVWTGRDEYRMLTNEALIDGESCAIVSRQRIVPGLDILALNSSSREGVMMKGAGPENSMLYGERQ
ncbi:hypothetical protein Tco_0286468 [Tanacetum coccineum]